MPKVYNKYHKDAPPGAVYVGRGYSRWGNPFRIGPDGTREEVVRKYREWLTAEPTLVAAVKRDLVGKDLVCWCAPKSCHADVLLEIANAE